MKDLLYRAEAVMQYMSHETHPSTLPMMIELRDAVASMMEEVSHHQRDHHPKEELT